MEGIRPHTHEDRARVIREITPLIQACFGENLLALAVSASYARGDDGPYSDLELTAFVQNMPHGKTHDGMARICDGMLVELVWMTREEYIRRTLDMNEVWFLSASDRLEPILNPSWIEDLQNVVIENLPERCLRQAVRNWPEVQESTAKTLNAIHAGNRDGLGLVAWDMLHHMLICLAYLNARPYVTFARFITEARTLPVQPEHFQELAEQFVSGRLVDSLSLRELVETVFGEFEAIFASRGVRLYDDSLDPGEPSVRERL